MPHLTVKTSTVYIAVGGKTMVFRSVDDVPRSLRKRLEQSMTGINSATILIADRRGREEVLRALRGKPAGVASRFAAAWRAENDGSNWGRFRVVWRNWAEILLPGAIGLAVWLLFNMK